MPHCDHCGASFDDEEAYLSHLGADHADELGRIEQRRVDALEDDGVGVGSAPLAIGAVAVVAVALVAYLVFFTGGSAGVPDSVEQVTQTPSEVGSVHYHGTMTVRIDGERIDFSQDRYQLADRAFHFEGGDGERWHAHARGITLEYALSTLEIGVTADSVWYDGTRYTDGENANVTVTVNGEPVDPTTYVLEADDTVRVIVETG
ncbi:hypothetical protein [Halosegnis sp.]|uniref:hypothetical protein n=1 Tax=Halosegnis sp. TaxID=2864959 RepID=UPI0035D5125B